MPLGARRAPRPRALRPGPGWTRWWHRKESRRGRCRKKKWKRLSIYSLLLNTTPTGSRCCPQLSQHNIPLPRESNRAAGGGSSFPEAQDRPILARGQKSESGRFASSAVSPSQEPALGDCTARTSETQICSWLCNRVTLSPGLGYQEGVKKEPFALYLSPPPPPTNSKTAPAHAPTLERRGLPGEGERPGHTLQTRSRDSEPFSRWVFIEYSVIETKRASVCPH